MEYPKLSKFFPFVFILLASACIIFFREPSIFTHPQFWGEDGKYWYGQAYNHGPLLTLFWPYAGSLQLMMRLVGSLSQLLPINAVPLFFTVVAAIIQALPALLLATKRFQKPFGSLKISLLVAFFYLLIPNSFEVNANLTNTNWHLALLALMIVTIPATSRRWRYFDYPILVLSGLTGPFSIFLLPITYYLWKLKKSNRAYVLILLVTATAQFIAYLLSHGGSRLSRQLGASPLIFLSIIGGRITSALFIGMGNASNLIAIHHHIFAGMGILTILFLAYVVWKGPLQLKIFVVFSWLTFIVALAKPQASLTMNQWPAILQGAGNRYFFLPMISIFLSLIWLAGSKKQAVRAIAIVGIALVFCLGAVKDFSYMPRQNQDFAISVRQFRQAHKNQTVCLQVNPGPDWLTCLKKH